MKRVSGVAFLSIVIALVWGGCGSAVPPPPLIGKIAFSRYDNTGVHGPGYQPYVMDADGSDVGWAGNTPYEEALSNRETFSSGERVWSPDGSRSAYISSTTELETDIHGGQVLVEVAEGLYVVPARDGDRKLLTREVDLFDCQPSWSPDGAYLTLSYRGDIWIIRADGHGRTNMTNNDIDESCPLWLPDS